MSAMGQELRPAQATLRMFDGTELPTLGMITATVRHPRNGRQLSLEFYITERENPLLGIDACRSLDMLRIVEHNICDMHESLHESSAASGLTPTDIFTRYGDLFDGSLGCMAGEVHLEVDPQVPPVQMALRRLPVALRDQVKAELDRLVANSHSTCHRTDRVGQCLTGSSETRGPRDSYLHRSKISESGVTAQHFLYADD